MLHVLHNLGFLDYIMNRTFNHSEFVHVANVLTSDPEKAFELTNHIECNWCNNPGVEVKGNRHDKRSTSVGDVIVEGTIGDPQSRHLIVDHIGWRELTPDEIRSLNIITTPQEDLS